MSSSEICTLLWPYLSEGDPSILLPRPCPPGTMKASYEIRSMGRSLGGVLPASTAAPSETGSSSERADPDAVSDCSSASSSVRGKPPRRASKPNTPSTLNEKGSAGSSHRRSLPTPQALLASMSLEGLTPEEVLGGSQGYAWIVGWTLTGLNVVVATFLRDMTLVEAIHRVEELRYLGRCLSDPLPNINSGRVSPGPPRAAPVNPLNSSQQWNIGMESSINGSFFTDATPMGKGGLHTRSAPYHPSKATPPPLPSAGADILHRYLNSAVFKHLDPTSITHLHFLSSLQVLGVIYTQRYYDNAALVTGSPAGVVPPPPVRLPSQAAMAATGPLEDGSAGNINNPNLNPNISISGSGTNFYTGYSENFASEYRLRTHQRDIWLELRYQPHHPSTHGTAAAASGPKVLEVLCSGYRLARCQLHVFRCDQRRPLSQKFIPQTANALYGGVWGIKQLMKGQRPTPVAGALSVMEAVLLPAVMQKECGPKHSLPAHPVSPQTVADGGTPSSPALEALAKRREKRRLKKQKAEQQHHCMHPAGLGSGHSNFSAGLPGAGGTEPPMMVTRLKPALSPHTRWDASASTGAHTEAMQALREAAHGPPPPLQDAVDGEESGTVRLPGDSAQNGVIAHSSTMVPSTSQSEEDDGLRECTAIMGRSAGVDPRAVSGVNSNGGMLSLVAPSGVAAALQGLPSVSDATSTSSKLSQRSGSFDSILEMDLDIRPNFNNNAMNASNTTNNMSGNNNAFHLSSVAVSSGLSPEVALLAHLGSSVVSPVNSVSGVTHYRTSACLTTTPCASAGSHAAAAAHPHSAVTPARLVSHPTNSSTPFISSQREVGAMGCAGGSVTNTAVFHEEYVIPTTSHPSPSMVLHPIENYRFLTRQRSRGVSAVRKRGLPPGNGSSESHRMTSRSPSANSSRSSSPHTGEVTDDIRRRDLWFQPRSKRHAAWRKEHLGWHHGKAERSQRHSGMERGHCSPKGDENTISPQEESPKKEANAAKLFESLLPFENSSNKTRRKGDAVESPLATEEEAAAEEWKTSQRHKGSKNNSKLTEQKKVRSKRRPYQIRSRSKPSDGSAAKHHSSSRFSSAASRDSMKGRHRLGVDLWQRLSSRNPTKSVRNYAPLAGNGFNGTVMGCLPPPRLSFPTSTDSSEFSSMLLLSHLGSSVGLLLHFREELDWEEVEEEEFSDSSDSDSEEHRRATSRSPANHEGSSRLQAKRFGLASQEISVSREQTPIHIPSSSSGAFMSTSPHPVVETSLNSPVHTNTVEGGSPSATVLSSPASWHRRASRSLGSSSSQESPSAEKPRATRKDAEEEILFTLTYQVLEALLVAMAWLQYACYQILRPLTVLRSFTYCIQIFELRVREFMHYLSLTAEDVDATLEALEMNGAAVCRHSESWEVGGGKRKSAATPREERRHHSFSGAGSSVSHKHFRRRHRHRRTLSSPHWQYSPGNNSSDAEGVPLTPPSPRYCGLHPALPHQLSCRAIYGPSATAAAIAMEHHRHPESTTSWMTCIRVLRVLLFPLEHHVCRCNYLFRLLLDFLLGVVLHLLLIFGGPPLYDASLRVSQYFLVDVHVRYLLWFETWPAGLKLNEDLCLLFGFLAQTVMEVWDVFMRWSPSNRRKNNSAMHPSQLRLYAEAVDAANTLTTASYVIQSCPANVYWNVTQDFQRPSTCAYLNCTCLHEQLALTESRTGGPGLETPSSHHSAPPTGFLSWSRTSLKTSIPRALFFLSSAPGVASATVEMSLPSWRRLEQADDAAASIFLASIFRKFMRLGLLFTDDAVKASAIRELYHNASKATALLSPMSSCCVPLLLLAATGSAAHHSSGLNGGAGSLGLGARWNQTRMSGTGAELLNATVTSPSEAFSFFQLGGAEAGFSASPWIGGHHSGQEAEALAAWVSPRQEVFSRASLNPLFTPLTTGSCSTPSQSFFAVQNVPTHLSEYSWVVPGYNGLVILFLLGASCGLAFVADLTVYVTLHLRLLHHGTALIFYWTKRGLDSLYTQFRGKRYNPLRNRKDAYVFHTDQMLAAVLLFAVMVFLFPTIAVYYFYFAFIRISVWVVQEGLAAVAHVVLYLPVFPLFLQWYERRQYSQHAELWKFTTNVLATSPIRERFRFGRNAVASGQSGAKGSHGFLEDNLLMKYALLLATYSNTDSDSGFPSTVGSPTTGGGHRMREWCPAPSTMGMAAVSAPFSTNAAQFFSEAYAPMVAAARSMARSLAWVDYFGHFAHYTGGGVRVCATHVTQRRTVEMELHPAPTPLSHSLMVDFFYVGAVLTSPFATTRTVRRILNGEEDDVSLDHLSALVPHLLRDPHVPECVLPQFTKKSSEESK